MLGLGPVLGSPAPRPGTESLPVAKGRVGEAHVLVSQVAPSLVPCGQHMLPESEVMAVLPRVRFSLGAHTRP